MESEYIQIVESSAEGLIDGDYTFALLHIAWLTDNDKCRIVFGFVELFPSELVEPFPLGIKELTLEENISLSYCQFKMKFEEATRWYDSCRKGDVFIPFSEPKSIYTKDLKFQQPVQWPSLVATNKLSFVGSAYGTVRTHHIAADGSKLILEYLLSNVSALRWLSDCFLIEFLDHIDLIGSIYFVAPDPLFRAIRCTLGVGDVEYIDYEFVTRDDVIEFECVSLILNEHRGSGIEKQHIIPIKNNYVRVACRNKVDQISYQVSCNKRGILADCPPVSFIRNISVNGNIDRDSAKQTRAASAHLNGQHWFYGDQQEVVRFFKQEIGKAKRKVFIFDRRLFSLSFIGLALSLTRSEVDFNFAFSEEFFISVDAVDDLRRFIDQAKEISERNGKKIKVYVMKRKDSVFSDRLFIVDNDVWLFGNSIDNLENGIVVRLPYPQGILSELGLLQLHKSLVEADKWLENYLFDAGGNW